MKTLRERLAQGEVLILDGAMGTEIQKMNIQEKDWGGYSGCNEYLVLSAPERIREVHRSYYAAGSDIVETNTFGANAIVLEEFGLAARTREINIAAARLARGAADAFTDGKERYIAGSIGPGTKLASLGQVDFDAIHAAYLPQLQGLAEGGADIFMIETCQDPLHFKAVAAAARDVICECGRDILVLVSVTIEANGTMLVGSDMGAVIALADGLGVDILGINCATGPEQMAPWISELCARFSGFTMAMPNAGMPQTVNGRMVYSLAPKEFAAQVARFISEDGVQIAGGCCGTSPEYIAALFAATRDIRPAARRNIHKVDAGADHIRTGEGGARGNKESASRDVPEHNINKTAGQIPLWNLTNFPRAAASLYSAQSFAQEPRPFIIGERANTHGSKRFQGLLAAEDWEGMVEVLVEQEQGAHALDLSVAATGRNERADMAAIVALARSRVRLPLVIDSTSYEVLDAALKVYGGRPIINSVNLEAGEAHAEKICRLAKRHGAALIALVIDENEGMAKTAAKKMEVAKRIYEIAVMRAGLAPGDLIFDMLTFTLASGDADSRGSALETLEAMRRVKAELPEARTVLGLSNVSFGLAPAARRVLNSVFLGEALAAGLDMAILHAASILPAHEIAEDMRQAALALIHNTSADALFRYMALFERQESGTPDTQVSAAVLPVEERLANAVMRGKRAGLEALVEEARLAGTDAFQIINTILIPAMQRVGELFSAGKMQLPFVLESAETMRMAVNLLEPHIARQRNTDITSVVLATVRGDVHDIGKNLVDIILSNNGYAVHNLGIKCEVAVIIEKIREIGADALGLSGLLVKSTVIMKEYLAALAAADIRIPVLLGGAALTREWAEADCQSVYAGHVVYCADAFEGLRALKLMREGGLGDALAADRVRFAKRRHFMEAGADGEKAQSPAVSVKPVPVPAAPFYGNTVIDHIPLTELFPLINEDRLFRARWNIRRGDMEASAFADFLGREIRPHRIQLEQVFAEGKFCTPRAAYGYFPCRRVGEDLAVYDAGEERARFHFPRREFSLIDYFADTEEFDLLPAQVVTLGEGVSEYARDLYTRGKFREYLFAHGLAVELTETLAAYIHDRIRRELEFPSARSLRYSFGYPACPDLAQNTQLLRLLGAERIGVTESEAEEMLPEFSTSAFILHHPEARYGG
ncbi:MAG: homocysteine S-methyltransferase family protein [Spirochaetota bacterium]|nr:homocysteine S-methyltransferase family protein [Spirochaetota bacterium]